MHARSLAASRPEGSADCGAARDHRASDGGTVILALQFLPRFGEPQLSFAHEIRHLCELKRDFLDLRLGDGVKALVEAHRAQTMNYLKATRQQLGILLNFGHYPELEYRRVICKEGRYDWS